MQYNIFLDGCPLKKGLGKEELFTEWKRYEMFSREDMILPKDYSGKPIEKHKCMCSATYRSMSGRSIRVQFTNSYKGHPCVARVDQAAEELAKRLGAAEIRDSSPVYPRPKKKARY